MKSQRALLLDRDGIINVDHGYVGDPSRFEFKEGIFPFLRAVGDLGYRLAIITNQSGVARGRFTADAHHALTATMLASFTREGIAVDLTLVCFEHPDGTIQPFGRESFWRKPNPGMVLEAIRCLSLEPKRSAFLGDSLRDMEAAQRGGIGRCLWLTDQEGADEDSVHRVRTFDQALAKLV